MQVRINHSVLLSTLTFAIACSLNAAPVSRDTAARAAQNWPGFVGLADHTLDVGEVFAAPEVGSEVAWVVLFQDSGWAIAAGDDLLLPVYAFSLTERFPVDDIGPAIREILGMMQRISDTVRSFDANRLFELSTSRQIVWRGVLDNQSPREAPIIMGPLGTSDWFQKQAYNEQCPASGGICGTDPLGDPEECPTGCVATAMSQIMYYWRHPAGYDWANMRDQVWPASPPAQILAVSQLCGDAGVSVNMVYCEDGDCKSGAVSADVDDALENTFDYYSDAAYESSNTNDLREEIDFLRPVYVRGTGHAWVCDGYDVSGATSEYHWRMGWNGVNDVWATVDDIPGHTYENHVRWIAPDNIVRFVGASNPGDGSPNDPYENIEQAGPNYPTGATLIFKAGSDNTFAGASVVLTRSCILKGYQSVIRKE